MNEFGVKWIFRCFIRILNYPLHYVVFKGNVG